MPWARWGVLVGLLMAEVIILSLCYDAGAAGEGAEWWARLFRHAILPRAGLTIFAGLIVFGAARLRGEIEADPEAFVTLPPRFRLLLGGHLALLALFSTTSSFVLSSAIHSSRTAELWIAGWLLLLVGTIGCWAAMMLPLALWKRLGRRSSGLIVGAFVLGLAGAATYRLNRGWGLLSRSTIWIVEHCLRLLFTHTISDPVQRMVGTGTFAVQIDKQCAGYEGIALVCLFLGIYIWCFRGNLRFPQALLLVPAGIILSWMGNILRIIGLIAFGSAISADIAMDGFHSQAGWLLFIGLTLGLVVLSQRSKVFSKSIAGAKVAARLPVEKSQSLSAAYLLPLLVVLATGMVTRAFSAGFDRFYGIRVIIGLGCIWYFRCVYRRWIWQWDLISLAIGAGVFFIWIVLKGMNPSDSKNTIAAGLAAMSSQLALIWITFRVIGSVIIVPIVEELAFRGYLVRRLISSDFEAVPRRQFTWISFVTSSLLFGLLHGSWVAGTLAGMSYALAIYRRGRIPDAVLAHSTSNALLAAYVLKTGNYALW
ncbi:MAG: exosortase E/protease, VPEID-CTERM system [Phycisphaerae bacterium]|nr:exosortase E/protease, VPEID-CTERM system [Phycisphaerae bacterium]